MTNEEAQALIAEIKKAAPTMANGQLDLDILKYGTVENGYNYMITQAEKIINRFTDKPPAPKFRLTSQNGIQILDLGIIETIGESIMADHLVLVVREANRYCGEFLFTNELLKQHIEHCTKMLDYLELKE